MAKIYPKLAPIYKRINKYINNIGIWYNKAIIGVEKASTGGLILTRLKMDLDYRNIAKSKEYDAFGRAKKKIGITTSAKSKPIMIGKMQQWFDNGDIVIRSIQTLAEMKTYQFDGTSTNAVTGLHDDTVMACAIGINLIENGIQYLW